MKEIFLQVGDRVGILAEVAEILGNYGINIEAISAYGDGQRGLIRLVTNDSETARRVLERRGYAPQLKEAMVIQMKNRPGELAKYAKKIAAANINIEAVYLLSKTKDTVELIVCADNLDKLKEVL